MTSTPSWTSLLTRLGERCAEYGGHADAEDHIETCYTQLLRELPQHGDKILEVLLQCAEELPHKDPLYGTLVGLLNLEDNQFGSKVVNDIHARLQDSLSSAHCNQTRVLIRFLTVLMCSNVVAPGSVIDVFEMLVSSAATTVDEERGNPSWQPRADFYVSCILASLPWGGLELAERVPEEVERVLLGVEAYFRLRKHVEEPALSVFDDNEKEQQDYLEDLWQRVQSLRDSGWKVDSVPRPHLVFEARLATAQSHDLGPLECPETPPPPAVRTDISTGRQHHEAAEKYPPRMRRLHIFPASKTDEKIAPIDRFVVEEYLLDVLFYLNGCRKECAAYMVGLPVPFRYEYLMAETVLSQLLLLPKPPFKLVYYTIVVVDLCKALPGAFPAVVAAAVRALFSRVGEMDVECRTRLTQWLSHHLSNFQFVWPWEEWEHVIDQPIWSPQRVFVEEVLEKEVRLSYWDKVNESVQAIPRLARLLPPKPSVSFKYTADKQGKASEAEIALATELIGLVRGKKTARDVQVWAEEKIIPTHGSKVAIDILVQTFLYVGSKSFTHLVTVLEKFGQVLHKVAPDLASQAVIVEVVAAFWQNSHQMISIAVDRMMGYRIVSNLSIVKWVFSDFNVQRFHSTDHVWEVLRNAISKTKNRTSDLKKDILTAVKAANEASVAAAEAKTKYETAQALVDSIEQDQGRAQSVAKADWAKVLWNKKTDEANSLQEALEAKQALLARAVREQEALFVTVFQEFVLVLTERLSKAGAVEPQSVDQSEARPMDLEAAPPPEGQEENDGEQKEEGANGQATKEMEELEEQHWRRCTLGWLRFIARNSSFEVWEILEKLDSEVFVSGLHPLIADAVNSGLSRHVLLS